MAGKSPLRPHLPASEPSSPISSSDAGEREERAAAANHDEYWQAAHFAPWRQSIADRSAYGTRQDAGSACIETLPSSPSPSEQSVVRPRCQNSMVSTPSSPVNHPLCPTPPPLDALDALLPAAPMDVEKEDEKPDLAMETDREELPVTFAVPSRGPSSSHSPTPVPHALSSPPPRESQHKISPGPRMSTSTSPSPSRSPSPTLVHSRTPTPPLPARLDHEAFRRLLATGGALSDDGDADASERMVTEEKEEVLSSRDPSPNLDFGPAPSFSPSSIPPTPRQPSPHPTSNTNRTLSLSPSLSPLFPIAMSRTSSAHPASNPSPRRSPSRSPTFAPPPHPEDSDPEIPPDPDPPAGGRTFRKRTIAQLRPYAVEDTLYQKSLLKNGWRGAVVAGPRAHEETPEELRRKKEEAERKARDDLGGWLEFEEGQAVEHGREEGSRIEESEEESEDGLTILEREQKRAERRARRMDKDVEKAFGERGKKRRVSKAPNEDDCGSDFWPIPLRPDRDPTHGGTAKGKGRERSWSRDTLQARPSKAHRPSNGGDQRPGTSTSKPRARALPAGGKGHSSDGDQSRSTSAAPRPSRKAKKRANAHSRANSESPSSSQPDPANGAAAAAGGASKAKRKKVKSRAKELMMGHKPLHLHHRKGGGTDAAIMELSSPEESEEEERGQQARKSGVIDLTGDGDEEEDESADEDEEDDDDIPVVEFVPITSLEGARSKKALRRMMPANFYKRAQEDLRLMAQEQELGLLDGDLGSGDEEVEQRRGRGRIRRSPGRGDEPLNLDGEAFTDESGSDGRSTPGKDDEDEDDAVTSWLSNFAPRRSLGRDHIDELLAKTQSMRQPKSRQAKGKTTAKPSRPPPPGGERDRHRLQDEGNGRSGQRKPNATAHAKAKARRLPHQKSNAIALDTDDAIFDFDALERLDRLDDNDGGFLEIENRDPSALQGLPCLVEDRTSERWASFAKFSYDFEIRRLPFGVQFGPKSFVKRGHLFSLLNPPTNPSHHRRCHPFDLQLDSSMFADDFDSALPPLCDAIFDAAVILLEDGGNEETDADPTGEAMRFVGAYISEVTVDLASDIATPLAASISSQLDRLDVRLDSLQPPKTAKAFQRHIITLSWYQVDVAVRLLSSPVGASVTPDRFERLTTSLVKRLVAYGPEHTTKSLKVVMARILPGPDADADADVAPLVVDDASVEAWLGLISLALRPPNAEQTWIFGEKEFWELVMREVDAAVPAVARRGPIPGEVAAYTAMMLCAISQFSPEGQTASKPRLGAHWPTVFRALDPIKPDVVADDSKLSNTALARRDRYLWTLFVRCLVLVDRWSWRIEVRNEILFKLFAVVNARHLADLSIENCGDFPPFLQDFSQFGQPTTFDRKPDASFTIFLRLVIAAAGNVEAGQTKLLTRMLVRVSPLTSGGWTHDSPELERGSVLVNHYSLLMTLAALAPSTSSNRLDQARRLVVFDEIDHRARMASVRAMLYFSVIYRANGLPLQPIVEWIADVAMQLRLEYSEIKQQRGNNPARKTTKEIDPLWRRAVLLAMVLRGVQGVLRWKRDETAAPAYPDLALLDPTWTTQLIASPVALDPLTGLEVVHFLNSFFDVRVAALPRHQSTKTAVSQDEFGMFDMDFDDPALNQLLGVDMSLVTDTSAARAELQAKDLAFAELIRSSLSPALYRLLSELFADREGRAEPTVDAGYAARLVECWTRGLAVMVEHSLVEWGPYLRYGEHSWRRLINPVGRRDIGLRLAIEILDHDPLLFTQYQDEFLDIWAQSVVARTPTVQHALLSLFLNIENVPALFDGFPFERSERAAQFDGHAAEFNVNRIKVLHAFFRNAGKGLAQGPYTQSATAVSKPTITNLLRSMLRSMLDNLNASGNESRDEYATFIRAVLEGLPACGPSVSEQSMPDLKNLTKAMAIK